MHSLVDYDSKNEITSRECGRDTNLVSICNTTSSSGVRVYLSEPRTATDFLV